MSRVVRCPSFLSFKNSSPLLERRLSRFSFCGPPLFDTLSGVPHHALDNALHTFLRKLQGPDGGNRSRRQAIAVVHPENPPVAVLDLRIPFQTAVHLFQENRAADVLFRAVARRAGWLVG